MSQPSSVEKLDLRLKCPFTMMVSGPSNCGKTTFTKNVLLKRRLKYNKTPGKVYWFYKVDQPQYGQMLELGIVDEFVEGMITMNWIKDNIEMSNCTVVIDDMSLEVTDDTAKIFSIASHHYQLNVIFICQNLFTQIKAFRDISLNSTYHVIFKNPRDKSSITHFAKQFAPGRTRDLAAIYFKATKQPHTYLFIDYHQQTKEENRVLSNVLFEGGKPVEIYRLKNNT